MSDRADELAESRERDPRSTDDLLEETERLLSESGADFGERSAPARDPGTDDRVRPDDGGGSWWRSTEDATAHETDADAGSSRLPSLPSALSIRRYFSPKEFLALVLVVGAGLLAGGLALPIAGRIVGMFAVAFAVGLLASRRRYLEMSAAGVSVGGAAALANYAVLAVAGSGQAVVAVGASAGLLACVGGYYFGRDLRAGLLADLE